MDEKTYRKIVVFGDQKVGKTLLFNMLAGHKSAESCPYNSSFQDEYITFSHINYQLKVMIMPGNQERYQEAILEQRVVAWIKESQLAVIMIDPLLDVQAQLNTILRYREELKKYNVPLSNIMVLAFCRSAESYPILFPPNLEILELSVNQYTHCALSNPSDVDTLKNQLLQKFIDLIEGKSADLSESDSVKSSTSCGSANNLFDVEIHSSDKLSPSTPLLPKQVKNQSSCWSFFSCCKPKETDSSCHDDLSDDGPRLVFQSAGKSWR